MHRLLLSLTGFLLCALLPRLAAGQVPPPTFEAADELFAAQHWAEAQASFDRLRDSEKDWHAPAQRRAVEGGVQSALKLRQWDDALARAADYVARTPGSLEEARGRRMLAGLYLTIPHRGLLRGTKLERREGGYWGDVSSWKKDRREAIGELERARAVVERLLAQPAEDTGRRGAERGPAIRAEWIRLNFDLVSALVYPASESPRFARWGLCGWWWAGRSEAEEESEAVAEADYEESRQDWRRRPFAEDEEEQARPVGLPLDREGRPQFLETPRAYDPALGAGLKIRYLLDEVQRLDDSPARTEAAAALYRWAMIARSLYGPETSRPPEREVRYDRLGRALPPAPDPSAPRTKLWELAGDQALTLAGGRIRVVTLPPQEDPLALLRQVGEKFPADPLAVEAHYARALYLQTRLQFPEAIEEYERLIARHPGHARARAAAQQIAQIRQPGVVLDSSGIHLPGAEIRLGFTSRNLDRIEFTARRVDLLRCVQDQLTVKDGRLDYPGQIATNFLQQDRWLKYLQGEPTRWSESIRRDPSGRVVAGSSRAPLTEPGAYVVEAAAAGGEEPSRVLVLISDIAMVKKTAVKRGLILVADARSGQPLVEQPVRIYEHWQEYNPTRSTYDARVEVSTRMTDRNGAIEYTRKKDSSSVGVVVVGEGGRMAFSFLQNWMDHDRQDGRENATRSHVLTDRPVYRPGATVKFRVWHRPRKDGQFVAPTAGTELRVELRDPKQREVGFQILRTDELGAVAGEFLLPSECTLGAWHLAVGYGVFQGDGRFRVEEYKRPEFEVTVQPSASAARPGELLKATITARYYFGAPVAQGQVSYKVFRERYTHVYRGPGEFDWLYGAGYGRRAYAYPWLPWWGRWGGVLAWSAFDPSASWVGRNSPWNFHHDPEEALRRAESGTRKALRELVAHGEAALAADGTYALELDPRRAGEEAADADHRYTIEAEVRDASRRTIEGKGSVLVTRQEFYAFVETNGGWYRPGNEAFIEVRTLSPDNVPVMAKGELVVKRVRPAGANGQEEDEEIVRRWPAETDVEGRLSTKLAIPGEGQYRITFVTRDSRREEVQGNAVFWVNGPKFDGRIYRFNDLEIIADKRTYRIGETARLLVHTAESNARLLFSDEVQRGQLVSWRFLDLPTRSLVIEVPIEARHVPNFFVEATLIRNGRVHSEAREILVPPTDGLLDVKVTTDRPNYRPGEKGRVRVEVTNSAGKPVRGDVTLAGFDESITYIQDEVSPPPRAHFHGLKRFHHVEVETSTLAEFRPTGGLPKPEDQTHWQGEPSGWRGNWGLVGGALGGFGSKAELSGRIRGSAVQLAADYWDRGQPLGYNASPNTKYRQEVRSYDAGGRGGEAPTLVEPEIRVDFAETALWQPKLALDERGMAETEITFPQSLTRWRLRGYALTKSTQVGDATARVTTSKPFIVRLQAPRFFVERDEVVLSAVVNNYLPTAQSVRADLVVPAALFSFLGPIDKPLVPDAEGNLHLPGEATVAANGEHRFDWPVKVLRPGLAQITVKALTGVESDGMRLAFPVLVHGVTKQVVQSGAYRTNQDGERTLHWELPAEIDPEQTRLELTLTPSLAGVMVDALPYLISYPHGCVEQTMSRFYPNVLVADTLKKLGTDLEKIGERRRQLQPAELRRRYANEPVFDSAELARLTKAGLERIYHFQGNDGGWGWWRQDGSSAFQTAYVLQGLQAAKSAGVKVDAGVYDRGFQFLSQCVRQEIARSKEKRSAHDLTTQAYLAYVLSLEHRLDAEAKNWLGSLFEARAGLNTYGRALLALALQQEGKTEEAATVLRNLLQFVERDDSNETAWVRTSPEHWWFWWNNDIESNAWALRALVAIDPKSELAPRLVKWLLNNRRGGHYWRSTRDTVQVLAAFGDYLRASGELAPDYQLEVAIDGVPARSVRVTRENFFTFDHRIALHGLHLKPGPHAVTIAKTGAGALYYTARLSYFTKEEDVKGAGNELLVERSYFKLVPRIESVRIPSAAAVKTAAGNQPVALASTGRTEQRAGYRRVPLKIGDAVASGDRIEVVLTITAKNTYDYLAFEDPKPAGCEPVELRSGGRWAGGLCANVELRDTKVVFYIGLLEQGRHVLRYQLRAETPGHFHALPATGAAMYAPEVQGTSDEMRLVVRER